MGVGVIYSMFYEVTLRDRNRILCERGGGRAQYRRKAFIRVPLVLGAACHYRK